MEVEVVLAEILYLHHVIGTHVSIYRTEQPEPGNRTRVDTPKEERKKMAKNIQVHPMPWAYIRAVLKYVKYTYRSTGYLSQEAQRQMPCSKEASAG